MQAIPTALPGVLILEPTVFGDARGFFSESYNRRAFAAATGLDVDFVQDNHSRSARGVLRGLHYQLRQPQGKLVRVAAGAVFDVAVDIRRASPTFGRWVGVELTAEAEFVRNRVASALQEWEKESDALAAACDGAIRLCRLVFGEDYAALLRKNRDLGPGRPPQRAAG